jgi:hypothetical protein
MKSENVPTSVKDAYDDLNLPFRIRPGCMAKIPDFELQTFGFTSQLSSRYNSRHPPM